MKVLGPMIESSLPVRLVCTDIEDATSLNYNCGADYVKTGQRLPPAMSDILKPGQRACSLDGDADRVVFYYLSGGADEATRGSKSEGKFRLLDGDKIATLAAGFIGDLVRQAGLAEKLKIGVVQTAYANGSSTAYLKKAVSIINQNGLSPASLSSSASPQFAGLARQMCADRCQAFASCRGAL
jgi:phosphoacetylglucosamine mutase